MVSLIKTFCSMLLLSLWINESCAVQSDPAKPRWSNAKEALKSESESFDRRVEDAERKYNLSEYQINTPADSNSYKRNPHPLAKQINDIMVNFFETHYQDFKNDVLFTVPRIFHYIWLGGPIYKEYWEEIRLLTDIAAANGYQVQIWVDDPKNLQVYKQKIGYENPDDIFPKSKVAVPNEEYDVFIKTHPNLIVRNINDLRKPVSFLSPSLNQELWRFIDSERQGLTNYAAASDLLRYLILSLEGGIYIDTDRKIDKIERVLEPFQDKTGIIGDIKLPEGFTQANRINDIIATTANHPIMLCSVIRSVGNLLKAENSKDFDQPRVSSLDSKRLHYNIEVRSMMSEFKHRRRYLTLTLAGPASLGSCSDEFLAVGRDTKDLRKVLGRIIVPLDEGWHQRISKKTMPKQGGNKLGECLTLESKCDNTWLKSNNPKHAFTDDDLNLPEHSGRTKDLTDDTESAN